LFSSESSAIYVPFLPKTYKLSINVGLFTFLK